MQYLSIQFLCSAILLTSTPKLISSIPSLAFPLPFVSVHCLSFAPQYHSILCLYSSHSTLHTSALAVRILATPVLSCSFPAPNLSARHVAPPQLFGTRLSCSHAIPFIAIPMLFLASPWLFYSFLLHSSALPFTAIPSRCFSNLCSSYALNLSATPCLRNATPLSALPSPCSDARSVAVTSSRCSCP